MKLNLRITNFFIILGIIFSFVFYCGKKVRESSLKDIRLLDYKPKPMLTVKETKIEKAKFPVIDCHNHLRRVVNSDTNIADLVKIMDECNVQMVVDLDGYPGGQFEKSLKTLKEAYPKRFLVYTRIDWTNLDDPSFGEQMVKKIQEDVKKGAQALKIRKELGLEIKLKDGTYLPVDSPKLDPAWEICGKLGIPVTIHVADPLAFFTPLDRFNERLEEVIDHPDWMWDRPELYDVEEIMEQRNRMLAKHPNTNFIGAHVGGISENLELAAEWLDTYPNLYYDTSARIHEMGRQPYTTRKFLIKYADRIVFGTDGCDAGPINAEMYRLNWRWYETDDEYFDVAKAHHYQGRWMVYGVYLPDDVLQKIYNGTAKKLYPGL
jgi:predicted TIM-barrel fold metal-dependent hydrolase